MYRLLRFIDNETNTAPDYEVVLELDKFEESNEILNKFIKACKEKNLPYSDGYYDYMVIEYACEVPIKAESVFYYKDKESAFDGVEWDGRVIASSALGYDFTDQNYLEITNNVTDKGYIQWLEEFVKAVITKAKLKCSEIIIDDIEWNRNIFLNIDGHEYDIRTWSFIPSEDKKFFVFDATADIDPRYDLDYVEIVTGEKYNKPLNMLITNVQISTSKNVMCKGNKRAITTSNIIIKYLKNKLKHGIGKQREILIVVYSDLLRRFQKEFDNVGYFGNLKGFNDFKGLYRMAHIGMNRFPNNFFCSAMSITPLIEVFFATLI